MPAPPSRDDELTATAGIETVESHSLTGPITPGLGIFGPRSAVTPPIFMEIDMHPLTLHNWIVDLSCAYVEYTFTPWDGRNYYRRTIDYGASCGADRGALDVPTRLSTYRRTNSSRAREARGMVDEMMTGE